MHEQRLLIIGFGSMGPAVLPLILRHIDISPEQIWIIAADGTNFHIAETAGIQCQQIRLTPDNYRKIVGAYLQRGDVLLNLSVRVSSLDLVNLCQELNVFYLDTSNEVWPSSTDTAYLTTFGRRTRALRLRQQLQGRSTALLYHGANPGVVSHFAKQAVVDVAKQLGVLGGDIPRKRRDWATLAERCEIVSLHISERDTQSSDRLPQADELVNTWSIDGFIEEANEVAGVAWGTHEEDLPSHLVNTWHDTTSCRAIELAGTGSSVRVRSWVPSCGTFEAYVIPHPEAFSIAELFSIREGGRCHYQPTVHFAYRPCNEAIMSLDNATAANCSKEARHRLLLGEVVDGSDELGILVLRRNDNNIYWFGSRLNIHQARALAENNNATSLQVAAGVLSGLVWILENPCRGVVEPEDIDSARILEIAAPYLGKLTGYWAHWTPRDLSPLISPSWQFSELAVKLG